MAHCEDIFHEITRPKTGLGIALPLASANDGHAPLEPARTAQHSATTLDILASLRKRASLPPLPARPRPLPPRPRQRAGSSVASVAPCAPLHEAPTSMVPRWTAREPALSVTRVRANVEAATSTDSTPDVESDWLDAPTLPIRDRTRIIDRAKLGVEPTVSWQITSAATDAAAAAEPDRVLNSQPSRRLHALLWSGIGALAALAVVLPIMSLRPSASHAATRASTPDCVDRSAATSAPPSKAATTATPSTTMPTNTANQSVKNSIPTVALTSLPFLEHGALGPALEVQTSSDGNTATLEVPADRAAIGRALSRAATNASSCSQSGSARVVATFSSSGRVRAVRLLSTTVEKSAASCVRRALARAQVSAFTGAPVTVSKTVRW